MTNQVIPEAAVEAAVDAWGARGGLSPEAIVRNILEAAAPHMLREAWFEGFNTGVGWGEWFEGSMNTPEPDNSNSNPYGGRA